MGDIDAPCNAGSELTDLSAELLLVFHRLFIFLQQAQLVDVSQGRGVGGPFHKGAQVVITGPHCKGGGS